MATSAVTPRGTSSGRLVRNGLWLLVFLTLGCGLSAGCSRRAAPVATVRGPGGAAGPVTITPATTQPWAYDPSWAAPHARPVAEWGQQLLEARDPAARTRAAVALGQLGEKGYPPLLKGLQSDSDVTRRVSLQSLPRPEMVKHERELLPVLAILLRDQDPEIRRAAVSRISWFGKAAQPYVTSLQHLARNDPEGNVRAAADTALLAIQEAMTGKAVTGGEGADTRPR